MRLNLGQGYLVTELLLVHHKLQITYSRMFVSEVEMDDGRTKQCVDVSNAVGL